jgi:hypothetical protein
MTVTLTKKNGPNAWGKLIKGQKLSNMYPWWEMKDKYQKAMVDLLGEDKADFVEREDPEAVAKAKAKS